MRLISARQAWRDAFHESRDSVLAAAIEKAKLGKRGRVANETHPGRQDTNGRCAHMLAAGLVQAAILTLPKPLQHLGHFLYSPVATGENLSVAHAAVWFGSPLSSSLPEAKRERAFWVAMAALQSHKCLVHGRDGWGPVMISSFVLDRFGGRIDASNWARDWAGIWEVLACKVDKMDAQALKPVAAVVSDMLERKARECAA